MAASPRGREFWRGLFAEVEGGTPVVEVAERYDVSDRTLHWWCWKLRAERRERAEQDGLRLLPVVVRSPEVVRRAAVIVVELGEVRLRVREGASVEYVAALVRAMRAC